MNTFDKNYHTHTYRCKHATDDVSAYAQAAIDKGLTVLGISDHTALPDNRWAEIRMDIQELPEYCLAIDNAKTDYPNLSILKAAECEYATEYDAFYREHLLGELTFDYLIGAAHFFPLNGEWVPSYSESNNVIGLQAYAAYFIESMESGLFAFMAHPDLFGSAYLHWDKNTIAASRDIFVAAAELQVPLEINGYGLRKAEIETPDGIRRRYPWIPFWELACEYDIEIVVNSDAHRPEDVSSNIAEAAEIGQRFGLKFADLSYLTNRITATHNSIDN